MSKIVKVYVKKTLRLDLLNPTQKQMYDLGNVGLRSIKARTAMAIGADDNPAPPLGAHRRKRWSKTQGKFVEYGKRTSWWARKKIKAGLRPIRDLRGTGMMWPENVKAGKRKPRMKFVGHLMDQIMVRRVSENKVLIDEPSTRYGRKKARRHRDMLLLSPNDKSKILQYAKVIFGRLTSGRGSAQSIER